MFGSKRSAPAKVPSDDVIPVHFWDREIHGIHLYMMYRFDDVLDATKLHQALLKLVNRDGWRKLGARLRRNDAGKLEYHIPAAYDEQRPAIGYHHDQYAGSISEHPVASKLQKPSGPVDHPYIIGDCLQFLPILCPAGDPSKLDDFIYTDVPTLGLRISSFDDATLVTINWNHVLSDAMGLKALINAWSLVLHGREDEVPAFHGMQEDPLEHLGTKASSPFLHADKKLSVWQSIVFGLRFKYDQLWVRPQVDGRTIAVPSSHLASLREEALAYLAPIYKEAGRTDAPFVSDGDLLNAWWTRHIMASADLAPSTSVCFNNVFNLRRLLASDLLPADKAYTANAAMAAPTFFTAGDLVNDPVGKVAGALRQTLVDLGTRDQAEARMAIDKQAFITTGHPALFGDAWMRILFCTNWSQGKFFDIDFSPAVIRKGVDTRETRIGRPSWIQPHAFLHGMPFSNVAGAFAIIGKDSYENYYLQGGLTTTQWKKIDQMLAKEFRA